MSRPRPTRSPRAAILSLAVLCVVVSFAYPVLESFVREQRVIREEPRPPKMRTELLAQIFNDFRCLPGAECTRDTDPDPASLRNPR